MTVLRRIGFPRHPSSTMVSATLWTTPDLTRAYVWMRIKEENRHRYFSGHFAQRTQSVRHWKCRYRWSPLWATQAYWLRRAFARTILGLSIRILFKGWNVPSLGITVVGPYVTFYGIIFLGRCQCRLVRLTPMLSCVASACEGDDRTALYAAFSGALALLRDIDEDVQRYCLIPPTLPHADRRFPYISELPR
ncbi:hypothetical protein EDB87DRAFT_125916 [Lactarius vividus]|nr:hypothetical protein EDB87DRAFT_125916 [Lactarius vividus]